MVLGYLSAPRSGRAASVLAPRVVVQRGKNLAERRWGKKHGRWREVSCPCSLIILLASDEEPRYCDRVEGVSSEERRTPSVASVLSAAGPAHPVAWPRSLLTPTIPVL